MSFWPRGTAARAVLVGAVTLAVGIVATRLATPALALMAAALVALVLSLALGRSLSGPIATLTRMAESEREDFDVRGPPEVERLAGALRRMAAARRREHRGAESERDRLATIVEELGDAVLIVEPDDTVSLANDAAGRVLGTREVARRRLPEVVRDHEILAGVREARNGHEVSALVERGEPRRSLRAIARPLEGRQILLVVQDLTELRRLETVRRDFVANVSHELRTPIASLKAMAEALEGGALDDREAAADFVERIHAEVDRLGQLVEELLSLARIESGDDRPALARIPPAALLEDAAGRMRPLAERAGLSLEVEAGLMLPDVLADATRIGQVFANLIHNAVKFTPAGGSVKLRAHPEDSSVRFSVVDTGIGIPAEDLPRIFERFYKSDRSRAGGGTGLGLAVSRHIVRAHGGDVRAESEGPGRGATVSFTLPVQGGAVRPRESSGG